MSYKITIEHTREVRRTLGKKWEKIGTQEVEREDSFQNRDGIRTRITDIMGYTPEVDTVQHERTDILVQVVDDLDLNAVIRAINKL